MNYKILTMGAAVLALTLITVRAEDEKPDPSKLPPPASMQGVTFEKDIKPIFDHSCVRCHHGEKAKGNVHLDSLDGVIKGGKDGKAVSPGDSTKSPLVFAVAHVGDEDDFMPPPKNKANISQLTTEQVGLIRAWIDQGAK